MRFLWRRNWTDDPIPVEVIAWMPLVGYEHDVYDDHGRHVIGRTFEPAKVVAVAVVDNKVCSIDIDELTVEREN